MGRRPHRNSPNISVMHLDSTPPPSSSLSAAQPVEIFTISFARFNMGTSYSCLSIVPYDLR